MVGTRRPSPSASTFGGATWSYHPPQSDQVMMMADDDHSGLEAMALTPPSTRSWPSLMLPGARSESPSGRMKETLAALLAATSVNRWVRCCMLAKLAGLSTTLG